MAQRERVGCDMSVGGMKFWKRGIPRKNLEKCLLCHHILVYNSVGTVV